MARPGLVTLEMNKGEFQTVAGNVFVVGSGKLEVELGE